MKNSENINVAINAQLNPNTPGGSESNLVSLVKSLASSPPNGVSYILLALARYADDFQAFLGPVPRSIRIVSVDAVAKENGNKSSSSDSTYGRTGTSKKVVDYACAATRAFRRIIGRMPPSENDLVLRKGGVSVVHFPHPVYFKTHLPFIYEPWDLQHRHFPEFFDPVELRRRDDSYRVACEGSRMIVVATHWIKEDICRQYRIRSEKIAVIPRSSLLFTALLPEPQIQTILDDLNLPETFVFYPAMTFPHKNHVRLLQALAALRDRYGEVVNLICTGRIYKPYWPTIANELTRLRLQEQVRFLGPVPRETLEALFRAARFLIFPSLFEGLGLPLLEAMHHGLPIVAANSSCIPEVVGDAGLLFNGLSVDDMSAAIVTAISSQLSLKEKRLRMAARLRSYSWDDAVNTFEVCYKFAAGRVLSHDEKITLAKACTS